jgi:hypothetical protein
MLSRLKTEKVVKPPQKPPITPWRMAGVAKRRPSGSVIVSLDAATGSRGWLAASPGAAGASLARVA